MQILIIDDNEQEIKKLKNEILNKNKYIGNIDIAINGKDGIKQIKKLKPDIIILDIIMPEIDGIGVLEEINKMNLKKFPIIIIMSAIEKTEITKKAIKLGAKYYILKPFDTEILIKRLQDLVNIEETGKITKEILKLKENMQNYKNDIDNEYNINNNKQNKLTDKSLEIIISKILYTLKIPANIQGYIYLKEAIVIALKNVEAATQITKEIYPDISKKFKTTPDKIERSIRHAINITWEKYNKQNSNYLNNILNISKKPTNSELIAILSEKLRYEI